MEIRISGRDGHVTQEMKAYAEDKAERLERFFDRIGLVEVILNRQRGLWTAEMVISAKRGKRLVAEAEHDTDMHAAIDELVDKMGRQLNRWKEKMKSRRLRAVRETEAVDFGGAEEPEPTDRADVY